MTPRTFWPLAVVAIGLAGLLATTFLRGSPPAPPVAPREVPVPDSAPPPVPPPPTFRGGRATHPDPLLGKWQTSVLQRNAQGVLAAQTAFLEREGEYRGPLMDMAKGDPDARVRAFSVAVLGRMKTPPAEAFFLERLEDASEHPRVSSLQALEKFGTPACLQKVESLASDPSPAVQAAAAQTAKAVRSR